MTQQGLFMTSQKKISQIAHKRHSKDKCACVEHNKKVINKLLSKNTTKRLNNLNWLRQKISFEESKNLFYMPNNKQSPYFDYSCTRGLGNAYDYIIEHHGIEKPISLSDVCQIHYLICNQANIQMNDSFIRAGVINQTSVPMEIENQLENIIFQSTHNDKKTFFQAFDLHYQIILLQPFDDYNKRTARMVMNWYLIKNGYHPIAFTKKNDKTKYPESLLKMKQNHADFYYEYMIQSMLHTQTEIINQLRALKIY